MIEKHLSSLRSRMYKNLIINLILGAVSAALIFDGISIIISHFIYMPLVKNMCILVPLLFVAVVLCVSLFIRADDYKVAVQADKLGFKERFVTAYLVEKKEEKTELELLAYEDAINIAKATDFKNLYPIKVNQRLAIGLAVSALFLLIVFFLPIETRPNVQKQQEMQELLTEATEDLEKYVKDTALTEAEKKALLKEINNIKKDIKKAKSPAEATEKLMKGQEKLKALNKENSEVKSVAKKLEENKATENLGKALSSGDMESFNEQVKSLSESLKNMSKQELNELAKAFREAVEAEGVSEETKELLENLANALENDLTESQLEELSRNLNELGETLNELAKENADLQAAIDKINSELAKTESELTGGDNQGNQGNQGNSGGNQPTNADGQGQGNNGQASNTGQSGASGEGRGQGSIENANIYTADAKNYGDYNSNLNDGKQGTGEKISGTTEGKDGEIIPYKQVYEQYKNEAISNVSKDSVPYGVQDIVKDYFAAIE